MQKHLRQSAASRPLARASIPARAGAIGKALIAYLLTGSLGVAIVAFLLFWGIGC